MQLVLVVPTIFALYIVCVHRLLDACLRHHNFHVQLSMQNTPIHEWRVPGVPTEFQLFVKREDLTGSTLSGNKVRLCVSCKLQR